MSEATRRILLIVWHSRTGASKQMAHAARQGALDIASELQAGHRFECRMQAAAQTDVASLLQADAYVFCAPENLGSLSGQMKEFFDSCYYDALDRLNGRPYALLIAAGTDGEGAIRQTERICTGWRLRAAMPPRIILTHAQTPEAIAAPKTLSQTDQAACHETGATLAALLL